MTTTYNNIDVDDIVLSSPDKLDNCYMCNIRHNDNLLYIQTPSLSIDEITDEYIVVNIPDDFTSFINNLDDYNIKYTYNNCEEWFKKDIPYDAIEHMYENIDTDDNKLRIDLPYIKEKLQCKIFNDEKKCIELSDINDDDNLILILHFRGLKILKDNFHLDFYINQIKLVNNGYNILSEYSIIDDDEYYKRNTIDDYILNEEIQNIIKNDELKKQKEIELRNKMKELENELSQLNN
jgi:hypothetical protein